MIAMIQNSLHYSHTLYLSEKVENQAVKCHLKMQSIFDTSPNSSISFKDKILTKLCLQTQKHALFNLFFFYLLFLIYFLLVYIYGVQWNFATLIYRIVVKSEHSVHLSLEQHTLYLPSNLPSPSHPPSIPPNLHCPSFLFCFYVYTLFNFHL